MVFNPTTLGPGACAPGPSTWNGPAATWPVRPVRAAAGSPVDDDGLLMRGFCPHGNERGRRSAIEAGTGALGRRNCSLRTDAGVNGHGSLYCPLSLRR